MERKEEDREANAERERERETAKAQQAKLEVVTETMQKENSEKAAYTALLNDVSRYDGSTSVDAFPTSLCHHCVVCHPGDTVCWWLGCGREKSEGKTRVGLY